ncbi:hypothetical protein SELMODRAFT_445894 [Selaginella moellendorffii]|uniref:3D domain-containing protein n=1 Tax=Selaginella moellendorffii TaxID=88036 RepID=D8SM46_SELML|nr:hypothetical protein SELMODRAFT_445894 [Selaginella moellendorffii]
MPPSKKLIECTAYCSCGYCCNWEWGIKLPGFYYLGISPSWVPLRFRKRKRGYLDEAALPLIAKFWTATSLSGSPYYGLTSNGTFPAQARPPIFSKLSFLQYHKLPARLILFPWRLFPRHGTIAADTNYYPFGTRMFVPGYGWGKVEDRGGAIKGPARIDLYHQSHNEAIHWGRRRVRNEKGRTGSLEDQTLTDNLSSFRMHKLGEDYASRGVFRVILLDHRWLPLDPVSAGPFQSSILGTSLRALHWQKLGRLSNIMDPRLAGDYTPESLQKFGEIAERCLADRGSERPSIYWRRPLEQIIVKAIGRVHDLLEREVLARVCRGGRVVRHRTAPGKASETCAATQS